LGLDPALIHHVERTGGEAMDGSPNKVKQQNIAKNSVLKEFKVQNIDSKSNDSGRLTHLWSIPCWMSALSIILLQIYTSCMVSLTVAILCHDNS
jgi:hypothetical protein